MRKVAPLMAVVMLVAAPAMARGQGAAGGDKGRSFEEMRVACRTPADTTATTPFFLSLWQHADGPLVPSMYTQLGLQGIAVRFHPPLPLAVSDSAMLHLSHSGTHSHSASSRVDTVREVKQKDREMKFEELMAADRQRVDSLMLDAMADTVFFTWRRDGSISEPRVGSASAAPEMDRALVTALREAAAAKVLPVFMQDVQSDSVEFALAVSTRGPVGLGVGAQIFSASVPTWLKASEERIATALPGNPPPRFPMRSVDQRSYLDSVRIAQGNRSASQGMQPTPYVRPGNGQPGTSFDVPAITAGRVIIDFLVDTTGHVDMNSIHVVGSTDKRILQAAVAVLPRWRFLPAQFGRCVIPMRVSQPFYFRAQE